MKHTTETREHALTIYRETNSALTAARAVGVHRDTILRWADNYGAARYQPEAITPIHIPLDVMAERDERLAEQPRDLTAAFFGDPPLRYSALGKKLAQESKNAVGHASEFPRLQSVGMPGYSALERR